MAPDSATSRGLQMQLRLHSVSVEEGCKVFPFLLITVFNALRSELIIVRLDCGVPAVALLKGFVCISV